MSANWHDLIGQTITRISAPLDDADIQVHTTSGGIRAYHESDCCESVDVKKVEGDLEQHVGLVVTAAEDDTGCDAPEWSKPSSSDSETWTKLTLTTSAGTLTFWVLGSSNGYYRETLEFAAIKQKGGVK